MKKLILPFIMLSQMVWAQNYEAQNQRIESHYNKVRKNKKILCYVQRYGINPIKPITKLKRIGRKHFSQEFEYQLKNQKNIYFKIEIFEKDEQLKTSLSLSKKTFKVYEAKYSNFAQTILYGFNNQFSIKNKLEPTCEFEFAKEKAFQINREKIHISIHPHSFYDYYNKITENINEYTQKYSSVILLEEHNQPRLEVDLKEFFEGLPIEISVPEYQFVNITFDENVKLLASPAGHNDYTLSKKLKALNIYYTGGNHNYCMWNNLRNILKAVLKEKHITTLNIHYDPRAIILQKGGIIKGFTPPIMSRMDADNRLSHYMENYERWTKKYLKTYFEYFQKTFFSLYRDYYNTVNLRQSSDFYNNTVTLKGRGEGDFTINFIYKK
jgi:hypothetical protein